MTCRHLLAACLGLALIGPVRAENVVLPPEFRDVPSGSWQYAAVQRLVDRGAFTGYPAGTFSGGRPLTRCEFGIALQALYSRSIAPLLPPAEPVQKALYEAIVRKYKVKLPDLDLDDLRRLLVEFEPELKMLGWSRIPTFPAVQRALENGPEEKIPPRPMHETRHQTAGRQRARRDWERGEVSLVQGGCFARDRDLLLGVPTKASGPQPLEFFDEADAYNEEVYRLTLERGWPPNSVRRIEKAEPGRK